MNILQVKDIMTDSFQSCYANTQLIDTFKIFSKFNLNIIPIVDENNILTGILTKNKIIHAISNGYSLTDSISPLINFNPIYVFPETDILQSRQKLLHHMIGHAPVVNSKKQLIGIISTSQILFGYTKTLDMLQSQLQLLFDNLHFGLLSVDTNMNITAINPLAREILQIYDQNETEKVINNTKIIREMIQYILVNREKPPKKKINLNGYCFVVDCYPLFENKQLIGVMVRVEF